MSRSSTFIPTMRASLYKKTAYDRHGKATLSAPLLLAIAPVKLLRGKSTTSIRTDKSGSKSRAEETSNQSKILVHPRIGDALDSGDEIEVRGQRYEIQAIHDRYDMDGRLHHYEVDMI